MMKRRGQFCREIPTWFPTREEFIAKQVGCERMIAKIALRTGFIYAGASRNATLALWRDGEFHYLDSGNFPGDEHFVTILHPEDEENGYYDVFIPHLEVKDREWFESREAKIYFEAYLMCGEDPKSYVEIFDRLNVLNALNK